MLDRHDPNKTVPNDVFVDSLTQEGKISPNLGTLLKTMETSTGAGAEAMTRKKIETVISFRDALKGTDFETGKVAVIGSGLDWQFPVVLGATDIDMVDIMFRDEASVDQLITSVKTFDPRASAIHGDIPQVRFHINLGEGEAEIVLTLHGAFLEEYQPESDLAGVVESLGPTLHSPQPGRPLYNVPVAPGIAPRLTENSFIVNLDYNYSAPANEYVAKGLQIVENEGLKIAQVKDKNAVIKWSQIVDLNGGRPIPRNPSSESV